jgi:hypothetical protein
MNSTLKKTIGTGRWKKLYNEVFRDFLSLPNIISGKQITEEKLG